MRHDGIFALFGVVAHSLRIEPSQLASCCGLALGGGAVAPAILWSQGPSGDLDLEVVLAGSLFQKQAFDFACIASPAPSFWCLGVRKPQVLDLAIWVDCTCGLVGLPDLLYGLSEAFAHVALRLMLLGRIGDH